MTAILEVTKKQSTEGDNEDLNHIMDCHNPPMSMCGIDLTNDEYDESCEITCIVCKEFEYCDCDCGCCS